jgi:hypothetical protein
VINRSLLSIGVMTLLAAAWWLIRPADWAHHGASLEPQNLSLRPGQRQVVRLVNNEADVVALSFRLRFDEAVVAIDSVEPEHASILTGGNAIHLPVRLTPGVVEVPGSAVTGGRVFDPFSSIHRFTVRGVRPGTTTLAVEDLTVVDLGNARRAVEASPCRVTIHAR